MVSTASLKPTLASLQKILFPGSCSLCLEPLKPSQQAFCSYCVDNLPFILQACSHCSEPLPLSSQCPACQKKTTEFSPLHYSLPLQTTNFFSDYTN